MEITDNHSSAAGVLLDEYGITEKQAAVAYAMVRGGKPLSEILADNGVDEEEFTSWVRMGRFSEYASALASGFAQADAPYIWNSLLESAKEGNMQAIKLYFDIWHKKQVVSGQNRGHAFPDAEIESVRQEIFGGD